MIEKEIVKDTLKAIWAFMPFLVAAIAINICIDFAVERDIAQEMARKAEADATEAWKQMAELRSSVANGWPVKF